MIRPLLPLALLFALPVLAQEAPPKAKPPSPGELKVDASKLKGLDGKKQPGGKADMPHLVEQARQVTRGYYNALLTGDYEAAASFLHPDAIEPSRKSLIESMEQGGEGQTKATLSSMGVPDLNTLRTMPAERFFVVYAKSPLGKGVQVLNGLDVRVVLDPPRCEQDKQTCQVRLALKGNSPKGDTIDKTNVVYVTAHEGRFVLLHTPPAKN